jgi:hypothetical protein
MPTPTYFQPLVYDQATQRPLVPASNELLNPASLPVSTQQGNAVQMLTDGLYIGQYLSQTTYYVAPNGVDAPTSGSKTSPFQTIDYCLSQLTSLSQGPNFSAIAIVALKAGNNYNMTQDFHCNGSITFTFYGDTNYGDFDSPLLGGTIDPAIMLDLARPVIKPQLVSATNGIAGVRLLPSNGEAKCSLRGVRVDLPAGANANNSYYCDFVTGTNYSTPRCDIYGTIINITDITSSAGLFGLLPRSGLGTLSQFSSQFLIQGVVVSGVTTPQILLAREFFLKFYPDFLGGNQVTGSLTTGSTGSAIMSVNWPVVATAPVLTGKATLGTFPMIGVSYGLGSYFANLVRDNQGRPLNVLCAAIL